MALYIDDLDSTSTDGYVLGKSTTHLIGFHGSSPTAQRSGSAQAAVVTTGATASSPYGYSEAQANAIIALLNEIRATLVAKGLMKGSA